ncbi:hypothetical protein LDENG_00232470, partial [Lucifuga dentata]
FTKQIKGQLIHEKFPGENTTITTTHGKYFKSYLRMRYFLTKHLISTFCGSQ